MSTPPGPAPVVWSPTKIEQTCGLTFRGVLAESGDTTTGVRQAPSDEDVADEDVAIFQHQPTGQEFVFVPRTTFDMGISVPELLAGLAEVHHDPDVSEWRQAHEQLWKAAQPVRRVSLGAFLIGRTPLLANAVTASEYDAPLFTPSEARARDRQVVTLPRDDAVAVLRQWNWTLPTEAEWECAARCGGRTFFAGPQRRDFFLTEVRAVGDRYDAAAVFANPWGIWGLLLGEWVIPAAPGPPEDAPWVRGAAGLDHPWQDSDEELACLAGARGDDGSWRNSFVARPVIRLDDPPRRSVLREDPVGDYDEAVAAFEAAARAEKAAQAQRRQAAQQRVRKARQSLARGTVHDAEVRTVGAPGTYVVRLAAANGVLHVPVGHAPLAVGAPVRVKVTREGGVVGCVLADPEG